MGSELSSEEELHQDLLNSSVMRKSKKKKAALKKIKKNLALIKYEIEREPQPTTFYD
jgi:hypothetical protein